MRLRWVLSANLLLSDSRFRGFLEEVGFGVGSDGVAVSVDARLPEGGEGFEDFGDAGAAGGPEGGGDLLGGEGS